MTEKLKELQRELKLMTYINLYASEEGVGSSELFSEEMGNMIKHLQECYISVTEQMCHYLNMKFSRRSMRDKHRLLSGYSADLLRLVECISFSRGESDSMLDVIDVYGVSMLNLQLLMSLDKKVEEIYAKFENKDE